MARVGSSKIAKAFVNGESAHINNTYTDGQRVVLHGNTIMWKQDDGIYFSMCGWPTVVTKDRLNHLFNALRVPLKAYTEKFCPGIYNYKTGKKEEISSRLNYTVSDFHE